MRRRPSPPAIITACSAQTARDNRLSSDCSPGPKCPIAAASAAARVSFPLGFGGAFHGALSGRENVAFIARGYGASVRHTTRYVEEFAELGGYFGMPVNTYSSGMRARLAFGACLAVQFETYLIDEVTEIGDERFRQKCAAAFRDRMQRSDIILVTHNSRTIRQYCDRGAVLANGRLELYDDVNDALARLPPASERTCTVRLRTILRRSQPFEASAADGSAARAGLFPATAV